MITQPSQLVLGVTLKLIANPLIGTSLDEVVGSFLFRSWRVQLNPHWVLESVEFMAAHSWGAEVRMIHLVAEIYDEAGKRLPGAVFLRGYTVDVLTIISDGNREYVVLVNQPRVAVGGLVLSNPSGMIDGHEGVAVAATRELEEEVGGGIDWQLPCPLDSSIMGNGAPWLVSPGGSDETVSFFVVRGHVSSTQMAQLDGRVAGLTSENEATTVVLVPLNEVPQRLAATGKPDLKTLTAWLLYRYQQPARG